jgi:hypothetical protein
MSKLSLLKEYIKLIVETQSPLFSFTGPLVPAKPTRSQTYEVAREFAITPSPELLQHLNMTEADLDENGALFTEHLVEVEADFHYERPERQTREHPGDPGGYSLEDWKPVSLDGFALSPEDAQSLRSHMGDLTDDEQETIIEQYASSQEPDFDDGGYDPY